MTLYIQKLSFVAADRSPKTSANRLSALLFVLFCVSYGYFLQEGGNPNVFCRAALSANLIQTGRVDIDGYETQTVDLAQRNGHFYCDKAPGLSILALPATYAYTRFFHLSPEVAAANDRIWNVFTYVCAHATSALIVALAAVLLFRYLLARTGSLSAALVGNVSFGLGTPIFGWATSFFSHAAAGGLLLMGLIAFDTASRRMEDRRQLLGLSALAGIAFGTATSVEYTSLVPALIIGACIGLASNWRNKPLETLWMFGATGLGALLALLPAFAYHDVAFGSPFDTGYESAVVFQETRAGFFGIHAPSLTVIGELIYGQQRGLIWIAPIMLMAVWATVVCMRLRETRYLAIAASLVLVFYILMNAGFSYWLGGASTGPRYLTPGLAIMMLPLGLAWPQFGSLERFFTLALLACSILINVVVAAVTMSAPENMDNPLTEWIWPHLVDGELIRTISYKFTQTLGLFNLLPLFVFWALMAALIGRTLLAKRDTAELAPARAL